MAKIKSGAQSENGEQAAGAENKLSQKASPKKDGKGALSENGEQAPDENLPSNDGVTKIMTIGEEPVGHNLVTSTVGVISAPKLEDLHQGLVKILIEYPKEWDKKKFFSDGDEKYVSQETADAFIELGFATIIKD